MTYSTVAEARHRATAPEVKTSSALDDTRRGWRARRRAKQAGAQVEHDPFPRPDAPTQTLPPLPGPLSATARPPVHRDHGTDPDLVAIRIVRVCSQALDERWSSTHLNDALLPHLGELHKRSMREQEGGETIRRRAESAKRAPEQVAAAIEAAVFVEQVTGKAVDLDPAALGRGLAQRTANAHDLTEKTMVGTMAPITDDTPDPRHTPEVEVTTVTTDAPASPVHVPGDQVRPPIPVEAGEDETADPGADSPLARSLPHRPRRTDSFPASLDEHGEPAEGGQVEAMDLAGTSGFYLLHMGDWCLIEGADLVGEQVHIRLASGVRDCPHMTAQVRVLGADAAATLLAQGTEAVAS